MKCFVCKKLMRLTAYTLRGWDKTLLASYHCSVCYNEPTYNFRRCTKLERKNILTDIKKLFKTIIGGMK